LFCFILGFGFFGMAFPFKSRSCTNSGFYHQTGNAARHRAAGGSDCLPPARRRNRHTRPARPFGAALIAGVAYKSRNRSAAGPGYQTGPLPAWHDERRTGM